jgi:hypothetical protein
MSSNRALEIYLNVPCTFHICLQPISRIRPIFGVLTPTPRRAYVITTFPNLPETAGTPENPSIVANDVHQFGADPACLTPAPESRRQDPMVAAPPMEYADYDRHRHHRVLPISGAVLCILKSGVTPCTCSKGHCLACDRYLIRKISPAHVAALVLGWGPRLIRATPCWLTAPCMTLRRAGIWAEEQSFWREHTTKQPIFRLLQSQ